MQGPGERDWARQFLSSAAWNGLAPAESLLSSRQSERGRDRRSSPRRSAHGWHGAPPIKTATAPERTPGPVIGQESQARGSGWNFQEQSDRWVMKRSPGPAGRFCPMRGWRFLAGMPRPGRQYRKIVAAGRRFCLGAEAVRRLRDPARRCPPNPYGRSTPWRQPLAWRHS